MSATPPQPPPQLPAQPPSSAQKPVLLEWVRETSASPAATWALFSDTDRYNRAAGFHFSFDETLRPDGTVRRVGHAKVLGILSLHWEERPFRYRVPEWFESVRLFQGGPAERLVVTLALEARDGGGTRIRYTIAVTPRSVLTRPLVALELSWVTRPRVERVLTPLLRRLEGADAQYDPLPDPLTPAAEERLLATVPRIPPPIGDRLAALVREAPLHEQVQIHPLRLAVTWGLPEDRVLDGVLAAVREGLLALRWDLLCPECRGPKTRLDSLADLPTGSVHCPSCNIDYDGTFPDSLVVSVAPMAAIRSIALPVACIGSPGRQPHVVAQEQVPVSATRTLAVDLEPGAYRIRARPCRGATSLIVYESAPTEPITLKLATVLQPDRLAARPGRVTLTLENYSSHLVEVTLERRGTPTGLLTVGRLLERPRACDLLPDASLMPGMDLLTRQGAVLAVESPDPEALAQAAAWVQQGQPRVYTLSPQGILAVWADFSAVLAMAARLSRLPALHLAVSSGPITEATLGTRTLPMGSTVEAALSALAGASRGHAAIPVERADAPEVRSALGLHAELVRVDFPLSTGVRIHWIHFR